MPRHGLAGDFENRIHLFMRDRREVLEEVGDAIPRLQVVQERLDWNARPGEAGCPREDVQVDMNHGSRDTHADRQVLFRRRGRAVFGFVRRM